MKKIYSLKGIKSFHEVLKTGRRYNQEGIQVIVLKMKNNGERLITENTKEYIYPPIKIGISISGRFGKAITRNKTKRRLRTICSELLPSMEEGFYIILRPNGDFKNFDFNNSKESIRRLFKRAGILRQ